MTSTSKLQGVIVGRAKDRTRRRNLDRLRGVLKEEIERNQRISTRWFVITGAPGSGKTTIVSGLKRRGFRVVDDPARQLLEAQVVSGRSKHEIRSNYMQVQRMILESMVSTASGLDRYVPTFFDYSIPDNLAFLEIKDLEWSDEFVRSACRYQYQHAFLLEIPPDIEIDPQSDPIRTETLEQRVEIGQILYEIYSELGIPITRLAEGLSNRLNAIMSIAMAGKWEST